MTGTGTTCERCGTCCRRGGPALHGDDRELVVSGRLGIGDLVTVRRGELALQPLAHTPTPVEREFVKIQGRAGEWCCRFYDEENAACTIYGHRPLACRLLQCRAPDPVAAIAGKDLLDRFDCMAADDPLRPVVLAHERECPCPPLAALAAALDVPKQRNSLLAELTQRVNRDLALREQAVRVHGLSVGAELFYFGRPLFQLLPPLGIRVRECGRGVKLEYADYDR